VNGKKDRSAISGKKKILFLNKKVKVFAQEKNWGYKKRNLVI
jgi:hypothetical protein